MHGTWHSPNTLITSSVLPYYRTALRIIYQSGAITQREMGAFAPGSSVCRALGAVTNT